MADLKRKRKYEELSSSAGSVEDLPVILLFSAQWYAESCRQVRSNVEKWISQHGSNFFHFVEIDVEERKDLAQRHNIKFMPTLQYFLSVSDFYHRRQDQPVLGADSPWHDSGLVGNHLNHVEILLNLILKKSSVIPCPGSQTTCTRTDPDLLSCWQQVQGMYPTIKEAVEYILKLKSDGDIDEDDTMTDHSNDLSHLFTEMDKKLGEGVDSDALEKPEYVKYHHRSGSNSFLSENHPCYFKYDDADWPSVQHAYQAARFNDGDGARIRAWIREAVEPKDAKVLGREYNNPQFRRADFYQRNLMIMFEINYAKFAQNSKLRKWLELTGTSEIYHCQRDDAFWGLGPPEVDGKFRGQNWNGKILMLVREVLKMVSSSRNKSMELANGATVAAFPCVDGQSDVLCDSLGYNSALLEETLKSVFKDAHFPNGTVIADRYKVVNKIDTRRLGSYVGDYCYVCVDMEPCAPSLDERIRQLLQRSNVCKGLKRELLELQKTLCEADILRNPEKIKKQWEDVAAQVKYVQDTLFGGSNQEDAWNALISTLNRLLSKHQESNDWELKNLKPKGHLDPATPSTSADLARSAYAIELLMSEPEHSNHMPLVFLKTFSNLGQTDDKRQMKILQEIRTCSIEQPDLTHENLCDISQATHAASIEAELGKYGRVGFRARMPLVALEYCDGVDMVDFMSSADPPGVPAMVNGLARKVEKFYRDVQLYKPDITIPGFEERKIFVNELLQSAAAYGLSCTQALEGFFDIIRGSTNAPQTVDQFVETWKDIYVRDIPNKLRKGLMGQPLVLAFRCLRMLFDLINDWQIKEALEVLQRAGFRKLFEIEASQSPEGRAKVRKNLQKLATIAQQHRAASFEFSFELSSLLLQDPMCLEGVFRPCQEASYDLARTALSAAGSSPHKGVELTAARLAGLNLENILLKHVQMSPYKKRLEVHGQAFCKDDFLSLPIALHLFRQAAEGVKKLHDNGFFHGDIKLDNFVLTASGQVKLIDFGSLKPFDQVDVANFDPDCSMEYVSPEMRQIKAGKFKLQHLTQSTALSTTEISKASDIWMLGQMLYYLICRPDVHFGTRRFKFFAAEYHCNGVTGWDAEGKSEQDVNALINACEQAHLGAYAPVGSLSEILFKIFSPVQNRIKDIGELLNLMDQHWPVEALGGAVKAHKELLQLAWPLFVPAPGLAEAPTQAALFELDLRYVKVLGGKDEYWHIFEVGHSLSGVTVDGIQLEIEDRILTINGCGPSKGSKLRTGQFYSKVELRIAKKGTGEDWKQKQTISLRRTRPVPQEKPAPDPVRFRNYLAAMNFWTPWKSDENSTDADMMKMDLRLLKTELARWSSKHRSELTPEALREAWARRRWTTPCTGTPDQGEHFYYKRILPSSPV